MGYEYAQVDRRERPARVAASVSEGPITQMWDLHHEVARRLIVGQKGSDIAAELGITQATVSNIRNSPIVREKLAILHQKADDEAINLSQRIRSIAPKALKLLEEALDGEVAGVSTNTRLRVAESFLDRAGHGAIKNIRGEMAVAHLTTDDINTIKSRALEAGLASGILVTSVEG